MFVGEKHQLKAEHQRRRSLLVKNTNKGGGGVVLFADSFCNPHVPHVEDAALFAVAELALAERLIINLYST